MDIPKKKLTNGFEIPEFGIGTWLMGGTKVRDPKNDDKGDVEAIQQAIQMGITHIDTAENYAEGQAEKIVGMAIKDFQREALFIVSKVGKNHLKEHDVINSAKATLDRLGTKYLDLYLIHAPNPEVPLKETMKALDSLHANGLIKYIGVSNFAKERLEEAQQYTKNNIVMNQVYYNLIQREPETSGLLSYCQKNDVLLEAYRPIEKGELLQKNSDIIDSLCKKYSKTKVQIALNWLLSQKNVTAITKMKSSEHMQENLGAVDWKIEENDVELIRKEFPGQIKVSEVFPLR
jgi:diketogulonate reductase-like aldo/keto reductase